MVGAITCGNCGDLVLVGVAAIVNGEARCNECALLTEVCNCCGNAYDPDSHDSRGGMCSGCAGDHFECESCGGVYHMDDYGENGLCLDCSDEFLPPHIHDYHHGADCGLVFHPREGLDNLYFGVELETDEYRACDSVAQDLFSISEDEHFFWLENDSSLINGIEIISQPCTLDYHLTSFPWARIVEVVVRNGGKSHDTTTCGLHIHFSRAFYSAHKNLYQLRLIYLFEKFWDELVVFSRRDQHQLEFNAKKYGCALFDCASSKKMEELYHNYHRYQAVNIRGKDTIELRIFRGTLDVATILASLELTDFLARLAKKTSTRKLQELTWAGIKQRIKACQYSYLLPYLSRRSL